MGKSERNSWGFQVICKYYILSGSFSLDLVLILFWGFFVLLLFSFEECSILCKLQKKKEKKIQRPAENRWRYSFSTWDSSQDSVEEGNQDLIIPLWNYGPTLPLTDSKFHLFLFFFSKFSCWEINLIYFRLYFV